jgi:hypothetical protein
MTFAYIPRSAEAWANRAGKKFDGEVSPAAVQRFLQPAFVETRRAYIRCAECTHMRSEHCTKRKLRPGQILTDSNWKGFMDDAGQIQPCSHTLPDAKPYACDSGACAVVVGTGEDARYCECKKFVSPNAKKRTAKPRTPKPRLPDEIKSSGLIPRADLVRAHENYLREQAAPKSKTKEEILIEVFREDSTLTPAQLSEASGRSQAWVRKHLRAAGLMPLSKSRGKALPLTTGVNP